MDHPNADVLRDVVAMQEAAGQTFEFVYPGEWRIDEPLDRWNPLGYFTPIRKGAEGRGDRRGERWEG